MKKLSDNYWIEKLKYHLKQKQNNDGTDIFNRILSVTETKEAKFNTVAEKVKSMQERSGYNLLKKQSSKEITAHDIELFQLVPSLKDNLLRYIEKNKEQTQAEIILNKLYNKIKNNISQLKTDKTAEELTIHDDVFKSFIQNLLDKQDKSSITINITLDDNQELGQDDIQDNNIFNSLTPKIVS